MAGPTYTYTSNTPESAQPMNVSQPEILANFQAIAELVGVNHVGFNINNSGKHNTAIMEFQSVDPGTASTDLALYSKATGSPNVGEIFYQYPNDGSVNQLTPVSGTGSGTISATSGTGWCLFASGILFKWGTATINLQNSTPGQIIFPTGAGIPAYKIGMGYAKVTLTQSTTANMNFTQFATTPVGYGTTQIAVYSLNASPSVVTVNYFTIGI